MGTFERSYFVDGQELELYAQLDGEALTGYQLVTSDGASIGDPFAGVPDEETVAALVRQTAVA
jgi:hypothetical protein